VEPDEVDNQLEELEIRVERLRALYEQYFMGIEKIEPAVPRKDVDRRIWVLRRTQIRNTAKRFKLHNIIQRYNTFQQYWQRICREIENGTYTRHLLRAVKRLGEEEALTAATRRRFGRARRGDSEAPSYPGASLADVEAELQAELRRMSEAPPAPDDDDDLFRGLVSSAPPLLPLVGALAPHRSAPVASPGQAGPRPLPPPPLPPPMASRPPAVPPPPPVRVSGRAPSPLSGPPPMPIRSVGPPVVPPRTAAMVPPVRSAAPGPVGLWVAPGDPMGRPRAQLPQATPPQPKQPVTATSTALTDHQLQDLHTRLMRARDQTGDRTRVSVEALAKTVDAAAAKLKQQHGQHRRVDFEVVIKDGKAVVRPVVR
jgi:hypothetical protein